jgi:hypothetical protein
MSDLADCPFPAILFPVLLPNGWHQVGAVRISCEVSEHGTIQPARPQSPLNLSEVLSPERPGVVSAPSDVAPIDQTCSVMILDAQAWAPAGVESPGWPISVRVNDLIYGMQVHGPREVSRSALRLAVLAGTRAAEAVPVTSVQLNYLDTGSGGRLADGHPVNPYAREVTADLRDHKGAFLPAIEPASPGGRKVDGRWPVAGVSPGGPLVGWRRVHAGSWDGAAGQAGAFGVPEDFSSAFFDTAPPWLRMPPPQGHLSIRIEGIDARPFEVDGELPDAPFLLLKTPTGDRLMQTKCNGIAVDCSARRLSLVYRVVCPPEIRALQAVVLGEEGLHKWARVVA